MAGVLRPGGAAQPVPYDLRESQVGPEGGVRAHHRERQHRLDHRHVRARHRVRTHTHTHTIFKISEKLAVSVHF